MTAPPGGRGQRATWSGRDALEGDFTEQVATPFNIDFRLTEACMAPMQATLTI
jgi:hypothetical protein